MIAGTCSYSRLLTVGHELLKLSAIATTSLLAQSPVLQVTNTCRPGSTDFQMRDRFQITIITATNQPISVRTTRDGRSDESCDRSNRCERSRVNRPIPGVRFWILGRVLDRGRATRNTGNAFYGDGGPAQKEATGCSCKLASLLRNPARPLKARGHFEPSMTANPSTHPTEERFLHAQS